MASTSTANPLYWWNDSFLPLGISFFTFEFYHYAWDRKHGKTEAGTLTEYLAFILFFPTMVAGPIKRYQDFLPKLRAPSLDWAADFERGISRILDWSGQEILYRRSTIGFDGQFKLNHHSHSETLVAAGVAHRIRN